jgi:hypothetical protein
MSDQLTRAELIATARFQQSMGAIVSPQSRRVAYGLEAQSGTIGKRDPKTGDRSFTDAVGIESAVRDLKTGAYPTDRVAAIVLVSGGHSYAR